MTDITIDDYEHSIEWRLTMLYQLVVFVPLIIIITACGQIKSIPTPLGPVEFYKEQPSDIKAMSTPASDVDMKHQDEKSAKIEQSGPVTSPLDENGWKEITNDLGGWSVQGKSVSGGDRFITIQNPTGRGDNYIVTREMNKPGTYKLIAAVKATNVTRGNKSYERGKFQAVVLKDGDEIDWPDNDFEGTFDWKQRSVIARITDKGESFFFRVGLQHAAGTIQVGNIHVYWKP